MKKQHASYLFSATDLANFLSCKHLTTMDKLAANGAITRPVLNNRVLLLLRQRGLDFEQAFLRQLEQEGQEVVKISMDDLNAEQNTLAAMQRGADVIYQARLIHDNFLGWADFLIKTNTPSNLGSYSYEVMDTKLAAETRAGAILQISLYSEIVAHLQGAKPEFMHIQKPEARTSYRVDEYSAYLRLMKKLFLTAIAEDKNTYPEPVPHCDICAWWETCNQRRRSDDHLSFIAGMGTAQRKEMRSHAVDTLEAMASLPLPLSFTPQRGSVTTYTKLREQARLQKMTREQQQVHVELLPLEKDKGFFKLPEPTEGDIYLDFEGDPLVEPNGREYLTGWWYQKSYYHCWAINDAEEKIALEALVDFITTAQQQHPDLHIYHFGAYESAALKRLMSKHATREEEIDALLRGEVLVDLHTVVRQAIRAGVERYSLKDLERVHGYVREMDLRTLSKIKAELEFLIEINQTELAEEQTWNGVKIYNQDDCISTYHLHRWLEKKRAERVAAGDTIPRPPIKPTEAGEKVTAHQQLIKPVFDALLQGVPPEKTNRDAGQEGRYLLAHFLDWYRREKKSFWWEYFRLLDLPDEELLDEKNALTGLSFTGERVADKRSQIDTYRFPTQECDLRKGYKVKTRDGRALGEITDLNIPQQLIKLRKGPNMAEHHPASIYYLEDINQRIKEQTIVRMGTWVSQHGLSSANAAFRSGRGLLLRQPPRFSSAISLTDSTIPLEHKVLALDHSVLAIQGPPGAGKSWTAARMILELVKQKKKVGVTALSHKVISELLDKIQEAAAAQNMTVNMTQKVKEKSHDRWHEVVSNEDFDKAVEHAQVLAGTSFLWAREELYQSVDHLVIDEAGQLSLIDCVVVSQAAKNLVLLGDPQQLQQPQQGVHPQGTEVSGLEHLLNGKKTITPEQGIFLADTRRMHAAICTLVSELFYENKLYSLPELDHQHIEGNTPYRGAGLRITPVSHEGNTNASIEEVQALAAIVADLTKGDVVWCDAEKRKRPVTKQDIKIISPYNAQVQLLTEHIPGVSIGTVDKFQGQEAPIILYSMASSSPEDAPRGMEFLYSGHRFNVAVSRARALFILVASPQLFMPECKSPQQILLANPLCRFRELAEEC